MVLKKTELTGLSRSSLKVSKDNPRIIDGGVQRIAASLQEFGYVKVSIGVDEKNVLLYGHTTLAAFDYLATLPKEQWGAIENPHIIPEVTKIVGLTEDQKKAYRIVDNRAGEFTTWDSQLLLNQLQALEANDFDIEKIGFNQDDIQAMLDEMSVPALTFTDDPPDGIGNEDGDYTPGVFTATRQFQNHCPRCGFDWDTTIKSEPVKTLKERMQDADER